MCTVEWLPLLWWGLVDELGQMDERETDAKMRMRILAGGTGICRIVPPLPALPEKSIPPLFDPCAARTNPAVAIRTFENV